MAMAVENCTAVVESLSSTSAGIVRCKFVGPDGLCVLKSYKEQGMRAKVNSGLCSEGQTGNLSEDDPNTFENQAKNIWH
jgi:hypothetical protein